jgi:hypothetical protein
MVTSVALPGQGPEVPPLLSVPLFAHQSDLAHNRRRTAGPLPLPDSASTLSSHEQTRRSRLCCRGRGSRCLGIPGTADAAGGKDRRFGQDHAAEPSRRHRGTSQRPVQVAGVDIGSLHGGDRTTYRRGRIGFVFQFFNLARRQREGWRRHARPPVASENLPLAALGDPLGLEVGPLLDDWFMSTYETQGYQWNLDMQATTPLLVAVGVLIAALAAQLPALRVIRQGDVARIVRERSL